ncbi:hypothetical protein AAZX31_11G197200 [Glycine max]
MSSFLTFSFSTPLVAPRIVAAFSLSKQSSSRGVLTKMQLRFQLQGRSSVTKGKQGRVKETEGVLNGAVYSHCHGFFSVQKIIRKKPRFFVQQEEAHVFFLLSLSLCFFYFL